MPEEKWLPIAEHEGLYEVSNFGRVRSLDRLNAAGRKWKGRILKPGADPDGYLHVSLYGAQKKLRNVHKLVLEAFIGPCPEGMEGCHGNGKNSDNILSNLRWDTKKNNQADRVKHGTNIYTHGTAQWNSKLNEKDIEQIFDMKRNGCRQDHIAQWFGVATSAICKILQGKAWKHLPCYAQYKRSISGSLSA